MDTRDAFSRKASGKSGVGETAQGRGEEGLALHGVGLERADEDVNLLITALKRYHSYTVAKEAEDTRYQELADRLKRKPTHREPAVQPARHAKRRA